MIVFFHAELSKSNFQCFHFPCIRLKKINQKLASKCKSCKISNTKKLNNRTGETFSIRQKIIKDGTKTKIKPINPNCKKIDRAVLSIGYEKSGKKGLIEIF